jgi:hypothetical protein
MASQSRPGRGWSRLRIHRVQLCLDGVVKLIQMDVTFLETLQKLGGKDVGLAKQVCNSLLSRLFHGPKGFVGSHLPKRGIPLFPLRNS